LKQGRIVTAHGRFSRIRQVAPLCTRQCALRIQKAQNWLPWQCPSEPRTQLCLHESFTPKTQPKNQTACH